MQNIVQPYFVVSEMCSAAIYSAESMTPIFQVKILDSKTKEQLCFLDKVSRFYL